MFEDEFIDEDDIDEEEEPIVKQTDPYEICPNGRLKCICRIEKKILICHYAPCVLSRHELGIHERIIDHYIETEDWDEAYYYFKSLIDKHTFNCSLTELEKLKRENPNYRIIDLPPSCRIFYFGVDLKNLKGKIKVFEHKTVDELGVEGQKVLNSSKMKFMNKMNSGMQLLNHVVKDERYKLWKKESAQGRVLEKLKAMGENGVHYTARVGTEVDQSLESDERVLFANDPDFQRKSGIFSKAHEKARQGGNE